MVLYREFSKQEEIDTQYDPERGVPDFGIYARFFVKESTGVRQDLKSTLDVRFGPTVESRAAISWLYRSDHPVVGNRNRLFVAGHSAGGHQVGRLLGTDWENDYGLPRDIIKGGFAISGLFDLRPLRYSWLQPMIQLNEEIVRSESPQFNLPASSAPMIATVGGDETAEFKRQSTDYIAALKAAGLAASYYEQSGKNHFTAIDGFLDQNSDLCRRVQSFIADCESGKHSG